MPDELKVIVTTIPLSPEDLAELDLSAGTITCYQVGSAELQATSFEPGWFTLWFPKDVTADALHELRALLNSSQIVALMEVNNEQPR